MNSMNNGFPSLITADASSGLALAEALADQLMAQMAAAEGRIDRPGGTNYLVGPSAPRGVVASVLFYAIAAANRGWTAG
jgi:hypothetical protein